jgi:dTDP-4-dehydrorhamnose 3,5-epimerase
MAFQVEHLPIPRLLLLVPQAFEDRRGCFFETYKKSEFDAQGIRENFVQSNQAGSRKGVLRGLHYQIDPSPQGKLLRVVSGEIFDVAVDIRKGSPFYGKWAAVTLSGENRSLFWIPPGFAHGYLALADGTEVLYSTTCEYDPRSERGIRWDDPALAIAWPPLSPLLNERDRNFPLCADAENTFVYGE